MTCSWYLDSSGLREYSACFCVIFQRNYKWKKAHPFSPWGREKEEINNQAKHIRERLQTSPYQMILFNYMQSNKSIYIWLSWVTHFSSPLMSFNWIWNLHFKSVSKITWWCVIGVMCCEWGNKTKMENLPRKVLPREKWYIATFPSALKCYRFCYTKPTPTDSLSSRPYYTPAVNSLLSLLGIIFHCDPT